MNPTPCACRGQVEGSHSFSLKVRTSPALMFAISAPYQPGMASARIFDSKARAEVMQICDIFRAKIVDVQPKNLTIEVTGNDSKVDKFVDLMQSFGVTELTRTGKIALARK